MVNKPLLEILLIDLTIGCKSVWKMHLILNHKAINCKQSISSDTSLAAQQTLLNRIYRHGDWLRPNGPAGSIVFSNLHFMYVLVHRSSCIYVGFVTLYLIGSCWIVWVICVWCATSYVFIAGLCVVLTGPFAVC